MAKKREIQEFYLEHLGRYQVIFVILFGFATLSFAATQVSFISQQYRVYAFYLGLICASGVLVLMFTRPVKELLGKIAQGVLLLFKKLGTMALSLYTEVLSFLIRPAVSEITSEKKLKKRARRGKGREYPALFRWVGKGDKSQDYVGKGATAFGPDGEGDGIFVFHPGRWGRIVNLEIHTLNGGGVWNTKDGSPNWPIAVVNGKTKRRLNPGKKSASINARKNSKLLLYVGDNGELSSGRQFELSVTYEKGTSQKLFSRIQ